METRSTLTETRTPEALGKPYLLVLGPDVFSTYELPESGSLTIGRRRTAEIYVEDPLLSHDHARLHIAGGYFVEDLGSRNGTFVRQERLPSHVKERLELGDAIALGSCLLMIQATSRSPRARRVVSYGFFRLRLDEECERAAYERGRAFSIARLRVLSPVPKEVIAEAAARVLRPFDTLSAFAPDEYALLFAGTAADEVRKLVAVLCLELGSRGIQVRSGHARYPEEGRTAQELEAHCTRALQAGRVSSELEAGVVAAPQAQALYRSAERIASSRLSVLITGETGAGKDVLARFIHANSPRARHPFQTINCAALPEALLEGQLFGYMKGAFTDAKSTQTGLIEAANGGTVFLDEIAEVPIGVQAKLLRLLENGEIQRLGAKQAQKVDVRFIAATSEDLVAAVHQKRFRADLLYRLKGIELRVPRSATAPRTFCRSPGISSNGTRASRTSPHPPIYLQRRAAVARTPLARQRTRAREHAAPRARVLEQTHHR